MTQFTVGCDPEFFIQPLQKTSRTSSETIAKMSKEEIQKYLHQAIVDSKKDKENEDKEDAVVPICGILGGTKDQPKPILGDGYAVQEDGVAAEFNIPPCASVREFVSAVNTALSHIECAILAPKGFGRSYVRSLELKKDWITKFPNIQAVGCDPDYNAYEMDVNNLPQARIAAQDKVGNTRGAGGHVHVGYPSGLCQPEIMAMLLDVVLGLPYAAKDKQGSRRKWWGHAGLYRPKPYGVEYRTLSNFWIWSGMQVADVAARTLTLCESLSTNMIAWQAMHNAIDWKKVRDVIYREDANASVQLYGRYLDQFQVLKALESVVNTKTYESTRPIAPPAMPVMARVRVGRVVPEFREAGRRLVVDDPPEIHAPQYGFDAPPGAEEGN